MRRRKYLVTGGAGFIGSHLVEALLGQEEDVIAFDDLSTGSLRNLAHLDCEPRLRFVEGSVLDECAVDTLVAQADVIVHLAAAAGVKLIVEQPLQSFITNIRGSEIVTESAFRHQRPILFTSTSEIYGKNCDVPLREDDDRILGSTSIARWAYSTAKAVEEILAYTYHHEQGLAATVVRLFNTIGPRQSPTYGMVVPRLTRQAVAGDSLTVHGDGTQSRCFCHVTDVVNALVGLLNTPEAIGGIFNVGSQEEISMLGLAQKIIELSHSGSSIQLVPYHDAYPVGFEDLPRRVPAIERIRAITGWQPTWTLDDILVEAIAEAAAERAADVALN